MNIWLTKKNIMGMLTSRTLNKYVYIIYKLLKWLIEWFAYSYHRDANVLRNPVLQDHFANQREDSGIIRPCYIYVIFKYIKLRFPHKYCSG